jgi:hypothetical protein
MAFPFPDLSYFFRNGWKKIKKYKNGKLLRDSVMRFFALGVNDTGGAH